MASSRTLDRRYTNNIDKVKSKEFNSVERKNDKRMDRYEKQIAIAKSRGEYKEPQEPQTKPAGGFVSKVTRFFKR